MTVEARCQSDDSAVGRDYCGHRGNGEMIAECWYCSELEVNYPLLEARWAVSQRAEFAAAGQDSVRRVWSELR